MLEGLEQINWKELRHAYGSAEDVPAQIRALASNDKLIREAALTELWGNIIHQGTVYSATAYAIPFLIELLESPEVKAKPQLLVLVGALACGSSYHEAHQPLFEDTGVFTEEMQQPEWQHRIREERGWVEAAWRAVVAGTPTYLILLVDPLPEIRFCATYPLAVCGEHATEILPHLQRRLNEETDVRVQGSLLLCLSCIAGDNGIPLFEEYLAYSKHPLLRALAALCWVRIAKQNAPQLAIDVLTEVLTYPQPIDSLYMQLPWQMTKALLPQPARHLGNWVRKLPSLSFHVYSTRWMASKSKTARVYRWWVSFSTSVSSRKSNIVQQSLPIFSDPSYYVWHGVNERGIGAM